MNASLIRRYEIHYRVFINKLNKMLYVHLFLTLMCSQAILKSSVVRVFFIFRIFYICFMCNKYAEHNSYTLSIFPDDLLIANASLKNYIRKIKHWHQAFQTLFVLELLHEKRYKQHIWLLASSGNRFDFGFCCSPERFILFQFKTR